jgi:hypothetical protein
VDATLLLIKEAIDAKKDYDYICLRSGQDLLIKNGFKDFLLNHQNQLFIQCREIREAELRLMRINWPKVVKKRFTNAHPLKLYRRMLFSLYSKGIFKMGRKI